MDYGMARQRQQVRSSFPLKEEAFRRLLRLSRQEIMVVQTRITTVKMGRRGQILIYLFIYLFGMYYLFS
jgi:hypothetical protein